MKDILIPLFMSLVCIAGDKSIDAGPTCPDGSREVVCDIPVAERMKNVGGSDGAGLCVFTSITHSARWQNDGTLKNFQQWMRNKPGGGYPEKVDQMIAKISKEQKTQIPGYVQYTGNDPSILDLAIKTGRMPAVTYGYDERYQKMGGDGKVSHMVNLVHLDDKWAAVLDNNFIGENELSWMSRDEFLKRWKMGGGGWTVILLDPGPIPILRN